MLHRQKRRVVVVLADTHGGSRFGLLNPETVLIRELDSGDWEEWTPEPTQTQEYLWERYEAHIQLLREFAGRDEILVFHDGDLCDGNRYADHLMPDITLGDQHEIGYQVLLPLVGLKNVKVSRLVSGTLVHGPQSPEARVAAKLAGETGKDVQSYRHGQADVDGEVFEFAHHGPFPGSRDWLKGNVALYHLKDRVYEDRRRGLQPARIHVYAHYHQYIHVTHHELWCGERFDYDLVICPSYSGLKRHGQKVTRSTPFIRNGMVACEVIDGELGEIEPFFDEVDLRTKEAL